jgi:acyl-CoA thioester hydrolase
MENFSKELQIRWSDLDPNFHLRHSVYYDWGAFCRIEFMNVHGFTPELMTEMHFGLILLHEECIFRKEIRLNDTVTIGIKLVKAKKDFSRWAIQHKILKNGHTVAAVLTVEGAWIDTIKRKLVTPPKNVTEIFTQIPLAENFHWLD